MAKVMKAGSTPFYVYLPQKLKTEIEQMATDKEYTLSAFTRVVFEDYMKKRRKMSK
jgi:hypothetical protein